MHQTYSTIQTFFCNLATNPDIQKKAQVELDVVVGPDRLPTFDDYQLLPYFSAVIKEVLRWGQVAPMGEFTIRCCWNGYASEAGRCIPSRWG